MKQLLFLLSAVCILTACKLRNKTATTNTSNYEIVNTRWKVTELYGKAVADKFNDKEPFLELNKESKRYNASGGCNGMGGEFTLLANGRIKFSRGMSTMMACQDMEIEQKLADALIAADNYTINNDNLTLNKGRMAPLARFKAVKVQ